jgi:hypothetical protein
MFNFFALGLGVHVRLFRSRGELALENLTLRQQLAVLKRWHPRPRLTVEEVPDRIDRKLGFVELRVIEVCSWSFW